MVLGSSRYVAITTIQGSSSPQGGITYLLTVTPYLINLLLFKFVSCLWILTLWFISLHLALPQMNLTGLLMMYILDSAILTFFMIMFLNFCFVLAALFGEGNSTPLQYSCLENPMDGGASWAAVHGVSKSRI